MSFGPTTVQLASFRALTCGHACRQTPSQMCEPITQGKCWRAVLQAHFSYSMDLHGMATGQTPQAGRAVLFRERSFLGMDVQELTLPTACNPRHASDSGHSPGRYSLSDQSLPVRPYALPLFSLARPWTKSAVLACEAGALSRDLATINMSTPV
jgi:hypothetical protein